VCGNLGCGISRDPSKLKRQAFPDFVHPLFQRVKSGVQVSIVKIKYVSRREKSENPVVAFHIEQHLLNAMTRSDNRI
jgi:DNA-binding cell septation regulator SpoVG